jgi:tRNA modification GTPase
MSEPGVTRVFVLTPPGRGAIAVLRLEGPDAAQLAESCFRPRRGASRFSQTSPGTLVYGNWLDGTEVIDDVLACRLDVAGCAVEVCCHGGPRVIERIVRSLVAAGADASVPSGHPSQPWETHNHLDRLILDLVPAAKTRLAVRFLLTQRRLLPEALHTMIGRFRAGDPSAYSAARALLDGVRIVIGGPANAGKSTLFNALVGREAALTSPHPGTTRDWIEAEIDLCGFPTTLVDTAGFHDHPEALDTEAIRRATEQVRRADLVLLVIDGADPQWSQRVTGMIRRLNVAQVLVVLNKADARPTIPSSATTERSDDPPWISARTGEGLNRLVESLLDRAGLSEFNVGMPTAISSELETALRGLAENPSGRLLDELEWEFLTSPAGFFSPDAAIIRQPRPKVDKG